MFIEKVNIKIIIIVEIIVEISFIFKDESIIKIILVIFNIIMIKDSLSCIENLNKCRFVFINFIINSIVNVVILIIIKLRFFQNLIINIMNIYSLNIC